MLSLQLMTIFDLAFVVVFFAIVCVGLLGADALLGRRRTDGFVFGI